jgi:hypothetical protein
MAGETAERRIVHDPAEKINSIKVRFSAESAGDGSSGKNLSLACAA